MSLMAIVAALDNGWHMDGGWWFGGMMLWMLLFWGLIVFVVVWLLRGGTGRTGDKEDAIRILDRRFAEGELSPEEYRERKAALTER